MISSVSPVHLSAGLSIMAHIKFTKFSRDYTANPSGEWVTSPAPFVERGCCMPAELQIYTLNIDNPPVTIGL